MKNIVLVGFMGCGKSTLGRKLARKLNYRFLDSDEEIERISGRTISGLFEEFGETHFRELEKEYLKSLLGQEGVVLSTGGGMPCFNDNMDLIKQFGTSFYLKLSPYELAHRLQKSKTPRPLVAGKTGEELYFYVKEMLIRRSDFYQKADFILSGKNHNVNHILGLLG
ncbi:MAG: family ATPase [Crocinitomicaceae bacterium]|jgi:shikimate kinase|nr:family ATPase [Crocinitomicaceae bacterium]